MSVEDWHREHAEYVLAYCCKQLGPDEGADAAGEVWLKTVRTYDRFEQGSAVRAWLTGIARNECIDRLRQRSRRSPYISHDPAMLVNLENLAGEDRIAAADEAMIAARAIMESLDEMTSQMVWCIHAFVVEGWSYDAMATHEGVPIGTIRSRMAKVRRILRSAQSRQAALAHGHALVRSDFVMAKLIQALLDQRVKRMRGAIDDPGRYGLGRGGFDPKADTPYDDAGLCDCTGAIAWAAMISRRPKPSRKWWIESTACVKDIMGKQEVFHRLDVPVAGCFGFYPDRGKRQGHGFLVSKVRSASDFDIIDCSPSNDDDDGKAINERSGVWTLARGAVFAVLRQDVA